MSSLRDKAAIVGIGETAYVRRSTKNLQALIFEAAEKACADAGITPKDIDGIVGCGVSGPAIQIKEFTENYEPPAVTFSAVAPFGGGAAVNMAAGIAAMAVSHGMANYVLVWHGLAWGSQHKVPGDVHDAMPNKHDFETPYGWFGQPAHLGMIAWRHMHEFGTTHDQLGAIAVAHRKHAILNGNAIMREPLTLEDYHASRWVAEPFHLLDCCLINDGAGAYIVAAADRARTMKQRPVYIMGIGQSPGHRTQYWSQNPRFIETAAAEAAPRAYKMAGAGPQDMDFFQTYDCFTITVLTTIEDHGFCKKGEGGPFCEGGRIEIGGALPVNTHGGMLSQSYMQGMNHVCEAVRQLRGAAGKAQVKDAEIGLVGGYAGATYASLVLRR
jgi:acetyl-CoA acetyltransferase